MKTSPQWKLREIADDLADLMIGLYARWQDEKQFEQLEDYAVPIRRVLDKHGASFSSMARRPFGCLFHHNDSTYKFTINAAKWTLSAVASRVPPTSNN